MKQVKDIHFDTRAKTMMTLWLSFALILLSAPLRAATDYTIQTIPNTHLSDKNNYVSNPDGILNAADIQYINRALKQLEDSLSIEVAVVAVESIGNNDARQFATELFKYWGIGKKGEDNGLLIQLVTEPSQRSVVFETGYGLEGVLPDAICYRLQQQYMMDDLKAGRFSTGMLNGVMAVKDYLMASDYERRQMVGASGTTESDMDNSIIYILLLAIVGFPILILIISVLSFKHKHRKRICPNCGHKTFSYVRRETITKATHSAEGLAVDIYRCTNCGYTERKNQKINRLQNSAGPIIFGTGGGLGRGGGFGGGFGGGGGSWGGGRSGGGGSISRF